MDADHRALGGDFRKGDVRERYKTSFLSIRNEPEVSAGIKDM